MLQSFHTVSSLTGHFSRCVCERVKEDDYKLPELSLSAQSLMMEGLKSSARKSDTDTLNWGMHMQAGTHTNLSLEDETCTKNVLLYRFKISHHFFGIHLKIWHFAHACMTAIACICSCVCVCLWERLPDLTWLYWGGAGQLKGLKGCFCSSG